MKKKTIIYVYGLGRSGSTLLGQILGASNNSTCIGEFASFTTYDSLGEDSSDENILSMPCGCGKPTMDCPDNPLKQYLDKYSLFQVRKWFSNFGLFFPKEDETKSYLNSLRTIYESVATDVIVDTSKNPRLYHVLKNSDVFQDWDIKGVLIYRNIGQVWKSWRSDKSYLKKKTRHRLLRHLIGQSFWCALVFINHRKSDLFINFNLMRQNPEKHIDLLNDRFNLNIHINGRDVTLDKSGHEVAGNPSKLNGKTGVKIL